MDSEASKITVAVLGIIFSSFIVFLIITGIIAFSVDTCSKSVNYDYNLILSSFENARNKYVYSSKKDSINKIPQVEISLQDDDYVTFLSDDPKYASVKPNRFISVTRINKNLFKVKQLFPYSPEIDLNNQSTNWVKFIFYKNGVWVSDSHNTHFHQLSNPYKIVIYGSEINKYIYVYPDGTLVEK